MNGHRRAPMQSAVQNPAYRLGDMSMAGAWRELHAPVSNPRQQLRCRQKTNRRVGEGLPRAGLWSRPTLLLGGLDVLRCIHGQARSKRSAFITLVHAATKSSDELLLRVGARRLRQARAARSSNRRPGRHGCRSTLAPSSCGRVPRTRFHPSSLSTRCPCPGGSRRSRWSASPGCLVKTPCWDLPAFAPRTRRPPTRTVISGAVSVSSCALSISAPPAVSTAACGSSCGIRPPCGSSGAKDSTSVCSCDASMRPGAKGTVTSCPASFAAFSTARRSRRERSGRQATPSCRRTARR